MEKDIKSNLRFSNYIVDYVEFYYNPESNSGEEFEIDFNIKDHYEISDDQKRMVVDLEVEIFRDAREKGYPFNLNMRVVGFFEKLIFLRKMQLRFCTLIFVRLLHRIPPVPMLSP